MQLTPLSYLHANREYILLKLINKEWVGFTYINLYFEYSFRNLISYTCHIKPCISKLVTVNDLDIHGL